MVVGSLQGDGLQFHAPLEFPIFDVFGFSRKEALNYTGSSLRAGGLRVGELP